MSVTEKRSLAAIVGLFGAAEVMEQDADLNRVRVRTLNSWDEHEGWAQLAVANAFAPQVGDQVLVAGDLPDDLYVIGCLSPPAPQRLISSGGVYAELGRTSAGDETVRVMSPANQLLFEVNPVTGATKLTIPAGTLELDAVHGDLVLRAGGTVRVEGQKVELRARFKLAMVVSNQLASVTTWFRMLPERLQFGSDQIELSARNAEVKASSVDVTGETMKLHADKFQLKARSAETTAETVIEKAGNVYRTVRELAQLQAGRFRTLVSGISHFRSKRAYFSSEETFHIDGDQVNLG